MTTITQTSLLMFQHVLTDEEDGVRYRVRSTEICQVLTCWLLVREVNRDQFEFCSHLRYMRRNKYSFEFDLLGDLA